jgi:broad specificity phosphatase PhoE
VKELALRLLLIRHGEASGNLSGEFIGLRDDSLTARGREQAERLAAALTSIPVSRLFTSPLARARETADILAHGLGSKRICDDRLIEQDFGSLEGQQAGVGAKSAREPDNPPRWQELAVTEAPRGGEALQRVHDRALSFVGDCALEGGTIVCVSRVGPIKSIICAALAVDLEVAHRLFLPTASISVVDWKPNRLVRVVNGPARVETLAELGF